MSSPGIILTSKYSLPNSKDFTHFINYLTREKALLKEEKLTATEKIELQRIQTGKDNLFQQAGQTELSVSKKDKPKSMLQQEAEHLLNDDFDFNNLQQMDFTKMVSYMARSYALQKKPRKTPAEELEIRRLDQAMDQIVANNPSKDADQSNILNGVFDRDKDFISVANLDEVKDKFLQAQQNGSVMYQDVVSFDNQFLRKNGLLDDQNNLNEVRLKEASKKMMETMFQEEDLRKTGYWFASIHRNTQHVHIHFATVESQNTRKIVQQGDYLEPKGKRRQATLDKMKGAFTHNLLDHSQQLQRISELRNDLVQEVKKDLQDPKTQKVMQLTRELVQTLPPDQRYWNYGAVAGDNPVKKAISPEARKLLDELTTELVADNPKYQDYLKLIKSESKFAQTVYGKSKRDSKDYAKNKALDLQKRLGNSVLKELKVMEKQKTMYIKSLNEQEKQNEKFKKRQINHHDSFKKTNYLYQRKTYRKSPVPHFTPYWARKLDRVLSNEVEHQRNQYFYERMQQASQHDISY
ncbi:MobP2 family relaxase [Bombilactobacillus bombi]|uniref:MobP2 family relaxase n=1 Tax=Bombilactobacillus bombi TaxID=1303590 RepID=UPI0035EF79E9